MTTVQLLSYKFERCKICQECLHDNDDADISHAIDHYIAHGFELLHCGRSSYARNDDIIHGTTAILRCTSDDG